MFGRFLRTLLTSKKSPAHTRSRSWPWFVPSFEPLECSLSRVCADALRKFQRLIRPSRPAGRKKHASRRLGSEQLEGRVVPAATWTGLLDYHPSSTALISG